MVGGNHCCIPGCKTKYWKNSQFPKRRHLSLFIPPKDEEEFEKWLEAVKTSGKESLKKTDKICELHFTEDSINKYFETLLPDGTVWRISRGHTTRKKGSVPTIFPNLQNISQLTDLKNLEKNPEKRKLSQNNNNYPNKRHILSENLECQKHARSIVPENVVVEDKCYDDSMTIKDHVYKNPEIIENKDSNPAKSVNVPENVETIESENSEYLVLKKSCNNPKNIETCENENLKCTEVAFNDTIEILTYSILVNNLKHISKPDWFWGISAHDEFIMCAKWDKKGSLLKRVIIDYNLMTRVFLQSREIDFNNVKISCMKDITSILNEVDSYRLCAHVNDTENLDCDGYILPRTRGILCKYCKLSGDFEIIKSQYPYWLSKGKDFAKHQLLYAKIDTLNKRNELIKEQLNKILKIKAVWQLSRQRNESSIQR